MEDDKYKTEETQLKEVLHWDYGLMIFPKLVSCFWTYLRGVMRSNSDKQQLVLARFSVLWWDPHGRKSDSGLLWPCLYMEASDALCIVMGFCCWLKHVSLFNASEAVILILLLWMWIQVILFFSRAIICQRWNITVRQYCEVLCIEIGIIRVASWIR